MIRSSNPALRPGVFENVSSIPLSDRSQLMTMQGTVNRAGILLAIVFVVGAFSWNKVMASLASEGAIPFPNYLIWGGLIGGMALGFAGIFLKQFISYIAPLYAVFQGAMLGGLSGMFEMYYPGIVFQAVLGTFGVFGSMLFVYKTGMIKVTDRLRYGIVAATGGIFLVYALTFILGFFGMNIPMIHSSGPIGIGFSLLVIGVASFNLLLDFDLIEQGVRAGAPRRMEWFGAFALLMTLVWLYIEMLRLLAKLRGRN